MQYLERAASAAVRKQFLPRHFGATYDQPVGNATQFTHNDNIGSPRVALVYKPVDHASVYFSPQYQN
jgi:hypothetical protein